DDVRNREQVKYGFGLNVEQNLTPDVSVFARASWSDGRTATYTFAEVDRSVSAGASIRGSAWARREDTLGVGVARNALSQVHREYLAEAACGEILTVHLRQCVSGKAHAAGQSWARALAAPECRRSNVRISPRAALPS